SLSARRRLSSLSPISSAHRRLSLSSARAAAFLSSARAATAVLSLLPNHFLSPALSDLDRIAARSLLGSSPRASACGPASASLYPLPLAVSSPTPLPPCPRAPHRATPPRTSSALGPMRVSCCSLWPPCLGLLARVDGGAPGASTTAEPHSHLSASPYPHRPLALRPGSSVQPRVSTMLLWWRRRQINREQPTANPAAPGGMRPCPWSTRRCRCFCTWSKWKVWNTYAVATA
ncbi:unnamed protein product, partial [Urochloa humidicola]